MKELILASASARRRELMKTCGYEFTAIPSPAEEEAAARDPARLVEELSLIKARSVFESLEPGRAANAVVVGSDTVVVLEGGVLGKPQSEEEAAEMLRRESGKQNEVYTGLAVVSADESGAVRVSVTHDRALVKFAELTEDEIAAYVRSGEPMDKAGAYGIQGSFAVHIESVSGSYFTVVGLPVHLLYRELKAVGILPRC